MIRTYRSSLRRFGTVMLGDLAYQARRPLFIVWASILILTALGLSSGVMSIQSGDTTVGGTKAHMTSEFAMAQQLSLVTMLFYAFFIAVAAGMSIIQDEEWRLGELIRATPLRPLEYIWGKFAAVLAGCIVILVIHVSAMMFFQYLIPFANAEEIRGPFRLLNYLKPALTFSLPTIVFFAGISFLVGEWTRRPVLVFLLPVAIVILVAFFFWEWSPSWLDPRIDRVLMLLDPAGSRWLNETWLKVDRGVAFYNAEPIPLDRDFLLSRLAYVFLGLGAVAIAGFHFAATARGSSTRASRRAAQAARSVPGFGTQTSPEFARPKSVILTPLSSLGMSMTRPGLFLGAWHVGRSELAELRSSPGLYLFIPLLVLQTLGTALVAVGAFETFLLVTPAGLAVRTMGSLTTCLCLLLLFYTVESLERERSTRLAAISLATPIRTGSLLLGKLIALGVLAMATTMAVGLGGLIAILDPGRGRPRPSSAPRVLGTAAHPERPVVDGIRHGRSLDHPEPLCDLFHRARGPDFHGLSAPFGPDQLGRQLAIVGRGAGQRHERAGARSQGAGPQPSRGGEHGGIPRSPDDSFLPTQGAGRHADLASAGGSAIDALRIATGAMGADPDGWRWSGWPSKWDRGHEGGAAKKLEKDYWRKNIATYLRCQGPRYPPCRAQTRPVPRAWPVSFHGDLRSRQHD